MGYRRTIDQVVETLKAAKASGRGGILLSGSGCSVKGGIPDAAGFCAIIQKNFPKAYGRAQKKDYHNLIAALTPGEQATLVDTYIQNAKINWAHIATALLMREGYIDRVLTTNFDFLALRACALIGYMPKILDCAAARLNPGIPIPEKALIYLHGQRLGAVALHTEQGRKELHDSLAPLFMDTGQGGSPWVVAGYGGTNDPVFGLLGKIESFENGLYWVGYKNIEPIRPLREGLLDENKKAFFVDGPECDSFLMALAQKLEIGLPEFIQRPYAYLDQMIQPVAPFPLAGQNDEIDLTRALREEIRYAIEQVEDPKGAALEKENPAGRMKREQNVAVMAAQRHFINGDLEKVLTYRKQFEQFSSLALGEVLFWAYVAQGNALMKRIKEAGGENSTALLEQAAEKYKAAREIRPDKVQALLQWGVMLAEQAKREKGPAAEKIFAQAGETFQTILQSNSSSYEAYQAWGTTLYERGLLSNGAQAKTLFAQAIEAFKAALAIRKDLPDVRFTCGKALVFQSRWEQDVDADRLLIQAMTQFKETLEMEPEHYQALTSWGKTLAHKAKNKTDEEADTLWIEAIDKYKAALEIKPEHQEALTGLGTVLWKRGTIWDNEGSDSFYTQAMEKFQASLAQNPEQPEAIYGLGNVLTQLAIRKTADQATRFFSQAIDRYRAAFALQPHNCDILNSWGNALLAYSGNMDDAKAEGMISQAIAKYRAALAIQPDNFEALNFWGDAILALVKIRKDQEHSLLTQAMEKYRAALNIQPQFTQALKNWGTVLFHLAEKMDSPDADRLYAQAEEKYQAALNLQPSFPEVFMNLGLILSKKAGRQKDDQSDQLYKQAGENFQKALEFNPEYTDAFLQWGIALMEQARTKRGINTHTLLVNAKKKFQSAEKLRPGSGSYYLARLMALLANESGCREWLEKCGKLDFLPDRKTVLGEPDFMTVRDSKWFKKLVPEDADGDAPVEEETADASAEEPAAQKDKKEGPAKEGDGIKEAAQT